MRKSLALIGAAGVGAGLMYLFDPDRGKHRRALLCDKATHFKNVTTDTTVKMGRDVRHRIRGCCAELTACCVEEGTVSNDVLEARVRSKMGHVSSHTGAVQVKADDGRIILRGQIPATELHPLLEAVMKTRGVSNIENYLEPNEPPRFDAMVSGH